MTLRLAQFLTGLQVSSLPPCLDLGLIHEPVTSSTPTVLRMPNESLYDWWFTANEFVLEPSPLRLTARIFFPQLNTCGHSPYITSSLTRGWVCYLQLLLALASILFIGSESRGTRDHILMSQIREFPFCHLLRLAGLRWRYSTPPIHGKCRMIGLSWTEVPSKRSEYRSPPRTVRAILFFRCHQTCLPNRYPAIDYSMSILCSGNMCLASRWLRMDFRSGSTIPAFRRHVTMCRSDHSLIWYAISEFILKDRGKPREISGQLVSVPRFDLGTSRILSKSGTPLTMGTCVHAQQSVTPPVKS
jgi:hypothetical protein